MWGNRGYTIVEVILFLAISGSLMSIAFIGFNTRQQNTQFSQSMREIESQIADVFNDVSNGYFPNRGGLQCTIVSGRPQLSVSGSSTTLGAYDDCVFLGKVIGFEEDRMFIFTIAGNNDERWADDPLPTVLPPLDQQKEYRWGVRYLPPTTSPAGVHPTDLIGAVNGLAETGNTGVVFTGAGPQRLSNFDNYLRSITSYDAPDTAINGQIDRKVICFVRADGRQRAMIEVGSDGNNGLSTKLVFDRCDYT